MEIWEITEDKVQAVLNRIVMTIKPVSVIIFGSCARNHIGINSDLDILVVVVRTGLFSHTTDCRKGFEDGYVVSLNFFSTYSRHRNADRNCPTRRTLTA